MPYLVHWISAATMELELAYLFLAERFVYILAVRHQKKLTIENIKDTREALASLTEARASLG